MDAKAKVAYLVEYKGRYVGYATTDSVELVRLGDEETLIPVMPLTDHEASLAELVSERDAWQRLAGEWQQATERRKEENQTLLTGLEALAGEMGEASDDENRPRDWSSAARHYEIKLRRTLASADLEGKTDG